MTSPDKQAVSGIAGIPSATPGPWRAERYGGSRADSWFIRGPNDEPVAGRGTALKGADAVLSSAAPDMLSALEPITRILGFAEWAEPEGAETILEELINCYWADADAAIAKALGQ